MSRKLVNLEALPAQATRVCPISSLKSAFDTRRTNVRLVSSLDFASNLGKRVSPIIIMQKTNKSYAKRIKVTAKKKLIRRKRGQNHFNSKQSGKTERAKHKTAEISAADDEKIRRHLPFA